MHPDTSAAAHRPKCSGRRKRQQRHGQRSKPAHELTLHITHRRRTSARRARTVCSRRRACSPRASTKPTANTASAACASAWSGGPGAGSLGAPASLAARPRPRRCERVVRKPRPGAHERAHEGADSIPYPLRSARRAPPGSRRQQGAVIRHVRNYPSGVHANGQAHGTGRAG